MTRYGKIDDLNFFEDSNKDNEMDNIKDYIEEHIMGRDRETFFKRYNAAHRRCPECGSTHNTQTLVAKVLDLENKDSYRDTNNAICVDCGWNGIVHDLTNE